MNVEIDFLGSYCNDWPEIEILANDIVMWKDRIVESKTAKLVVEGDVELTIRYTNKRDGKNSRICDTVTDHNGNIIEDQYARIKRVYVNGSDVSPLVETLEYVRYDGEVLTPRGYLSFIGHYKIVIPANVDEWIIGIHNGGNFIKDKDSSSLTYYVNYIGGNDRDVTLKKLDQIEEKLNRLL